MTSWNGLVIDQLLDQEQEIVCSRLMRARSWTLSSSGKFLYMSNERPDAQVVIQYLNLAGKASNPSKQSMLEKVLE